MTSQPAATLNLMLVEDDPVFRQGLVSSLNAYPDLQIAVEASSKMAIAQLLAIAGFNLAQPRSQCRKWRKYGATPVSTTQCSVSPYSDPAAQHHC